MAGCGATLCSIGRGVAVWCASGRSVVLVVWMVVVVLGTNVVQATEYTVGGSSGWNLGVDFSTWASQYSFKTGDSLAFSYSGLHTVLQVSEADYKACSTANAITTGTGGNTVVKLEKEQTYYFICGTPGHCASGMQLSVAVGGASASPSNGTTTPSTSKTPPSTTTSPSIIQPSMAISLISSLQSLSVLTIFFTLFIYLVPKYI